MLDIPAPREKVVTVVLHNPAREYSSQRQIRIAYSHKVAKVQFIVVGNFVKDLSAQEMPALL